MKRRKFIRDVSVLTAGASVMPFVPGCRGKNPNKLINIGMIGTGSHGVERNLKHYLKYPELCRVVAVCDVSMSRATSAKNLVNNTYKNKDCKVFQDFRELLEVEIHRCRSDFDTRPLACPDIGNGCFERKAYML